MIVTVSSTRITISEEGVTQSFNGTDLLKAEVKEEALNAEFPNDQIEPILTLHLSGNVRAEEGEKVRIILNTVTNQPTWIVSGTGMTAALAAVAPIIRSIPVSSGVGGLVDGDYGDVTISGGGTVIEVNPGYITNAKLANMPEATLKGRAAGAGTGTPQNLTPDQASTILDGATDPFLRTSAAPVALVTSIGGNEAADAGKILEFNTQGQIQGSASNSGLAAVKGTASLSAYAVHGEANSGFGVYGQSNSGPGVGAASVSGIALEAVSLGPTNPVLKVKNANVANTAKLAEFHRNDNTGLHVLNDGGLSWDTGTGAATTRTNLGLGTAAQQPSTAFDTAGAAAAAQAAAIAANIPETVRRDINQVAHGLAVGDLIRFNGTIFVKAQADVEANAECVGIVSVVTDADNFTMVTHGYVTGLSGLTSGVTYFLSEITAGLLTATAPSTAANVRKAQLIALSTTTGHYNNFVGYIIP